MTRKHRESPAHATGLLVLLIALGLLGAAGRADPRLNAALRTAVLITMLAMLYVIRRSRRSVVIGSLLATANVTLEIFSILDPTPERIVAHQLAAAIFYAFTAVVLLRSALGVRRVSLHTISTALCVYLITGLAFGILFTAVDNAFPNAFHRGFGQPGYPQEGTSDLIYFSFCTLTTVGYGDISPVHPLARVLSVLEGCFGVMYPSILIAWLVGMYIIHNVEK